MLIVSEIDTGDIISFMSSGPTGFFDRRKMVEVMFNGRDDLQCHTVDIPVCRLNGCRVEVDHGIISRIHSDGTDVYKVDPEELTRMAVKKAAERKTEMLSKVPAVANSHLRNIFDRHIYRVSTDAVMDAIDEIGRASCRERV